MTKDTVGYLPTIDAPATSMNTVLEVLTNAKLIKDPLEKPFSLQKYHHSNWSFSYHHNAACNNWHLIWRSILGRHYH